MRCAACVIMALTTSCFLSSLLNERSKLVVFFDVVKGSVMLFDALRRLRHHGFDNILQVVTAGTGVFNHCVESVDTLITALGLELLNDILFKLRRKNRQIRQGTARKWQEERRDFHHLDFC